MAKYAIVILDSNLKPKKIASVHSSLALAKKKLQSINLPKWSKGADIVPYK